MSHYQKHSADFRSGEKHKCILKTVMLYVTHKCVRKIRQSGISCTEADERKVCRDIVKIFRKTPPGVDCNVFDTVAFMKGLSVTLNNMGNFVDSFLFLFGGAAKESDAPLINEEYYRCYGQVLREFDRENHRYADVLYQVIRESRADVLYILTMKETLEQYFKTVLKNFEYMSVDPRCDSFFIYRTAMVLRFFEAKDDTCGHWNELLSDLIVATKNAESKNGEFADKRFLRELENLLDDSVFLSKLDTVRSMTAPFEKYIRKRTEDDLHEKMKAKWAQYSQSDKLPTEFNVVEESEFYMNLWFAQMQKYYDEMMKCAQAVQSKSCNHTKEENTV